MAGCGIIARSPHSFCHTMFGPKHMGPVLQQARTPTTLQNYRASLNPFGSSAQQGLLHGYREPVLFLILSTLLTSAVGQCNLGQMSA